MLEDALAVNGLLGEESGSGEHGKAAVLELLGLHLEELLGVLGHEAEGVEAEVTRGVVGEELSGGVDGGVRGVDPALLGAELLGGADGGDEGDPELGGAPNVAILAVLGGPPSRFAAINDGCYAKKNRIAPPRSVRDRQGR